MNFEATFPASAVDAALEPMADQAPSGRAAKDAIKSIVDSGALGDEHLLHVHATSSERMVAVLVRIVDQPEDAR